jgi:Zn-finger nucleic acid-binding protein
MNMKTLDLSYDDWLKDHPRRSTTDSCSYGHLYSKSNTTFEINNRHGYIRRCKTCIFNSDKSPKTRTDLKIGYENPHGVKIIRGPERVRNTLSWWSLCPHCNVEFLRTTHKFDEVKSCYGCRGVSRRTFSEEITWKQFYSQTKARKRAKELGFDLSLSDFKKISQMDCSYCGAEPLPRNIGKEWYPAVRVNGLDRIDSSVGYLYGNVVSCCAACNTAKGSMSVEEFVKLITKIYERQNLNDKL